MPKKKGTRTKRILTEMKPPERICTRKYCVARGEPQPIDQFKWLPGSETFTLTCAKCRELHRRAQETWRNNNPEEDRRGTFEWMEKNREHVAIFAKRWLARLTPEQRKELYARSYKLQKERIAKMSPKEFRAFRNKRNARDRASKLRRKLKAEKDA